MFFSVFFRALLEMTQFGQHRKQRSQENVDAALVSLRFVWHVIDVKLRKNIYSILFWFHFVSVFGDCTAEINPKLVHQLMTWGSGSRTCKHAQPWQLPNVPPSHTVIILYIPLQSLHLQSSCWCCCCAATHHSCDLRFWDLRLASTGLRWVSGSRA